MNEFLFFTMIEEKITKEEFEKRAFMSTIQFSITNSINYYGTTKNIWKGE